MSVSRKVNDLMDIKILMKCGTTESLKQSNIILAKGEYCNNLSNSGMKIGDGETKYNDLHYFRIDGENVVGIKYIDNEPIYIIQGGGDLIGIDEDLNTRMVREWKVVP